LFGRFEKYSVDISIRGGEFSSKYRHVFLNVIPYTWLTTARNTWCTQNCL